MTTTKAALILDTEELLYGMARVERPSEDTMSALLAQAGVTMSVTTTAMWQKGDIAEFAPVDGSADEMVICAADAAGGTVTVRRAQRGTSDTAHTNGDVIRKNPLYPRQAISRMIDEIIDDHMWPHAWYRTERTETWVDGDWTYNLNANDGNVLAVYQYNLSSDNNISFFPSGWWQVVPQISTSVSATGKALRLRKVYDSTATVYYTAQTVPASANLTSLPSELTNLIPWGVAGQILGGTRTAPQHYDPNRQALPDPTEGAGARDWRYFWTNFLMKRADVHRKLRFDERHLRQPRYVPRQPRRWT